MNTMPDRLSELVERLAAKLVLGGADGLQWAALLESVRCEAVTSGRDGVARIAAESVAALPEARDADGLGALFSANITRMQHALAESGAKTPAPGVAAQSAPACLSLGEDLEMMGDFIMESRDHLTQIEIRMMTLEKDPGDSEAIDTVFRGFHTIKGLAGFLELGDIREVAHETETLLDLARDRKLSVTPTVVDVVLAAVDFIKAWCARLETD